MKKSLLMTIVVSLFLTSNIYANEEVVVYECSYDSVYWTGRGKSMKTDGGDMVVTINGNSLVIKSSSKEMAGTHNLTLKSKLGFQIVALSSSMQFFYNKGSNAFHVNAGIGPSGFSVSGGGHMGRQVRISGKCSLNQD